MKTRTITQLLCLAVIITASGCSTAGSHGFGKYADRKGIHTIEFFSVWGRGKIQHVNLETNQSATLNLDGTITVESK